MGKAHYIPSDYQDLYETYFDPTVDHFVRGLTRRYIGSKATETDVEDLLHAAFEKMLRLKLLEKFDPERGNFGLFIQQIVRGVVFSWHKKNTRTPTALADPESLRHGSQIGREAGYRQEIPTPEAEAVADEMLARLERFVANAADADGAKARDEALGPMLAILANGGEAQEAAKVLGVAPSTITQWRRHLRTAL